MGYNFVDCNRNQMYLMPPSLQDWLDEGDFTWFIVDAVGEMDISGFYNGCSPYKKTVYSL